MSSHTILYQYYTDYLVQYEHRLHIAYYSVGDKTIYHGCLVQWNELQQCVWSNYKYTFVHFIMYELIFRYVVIL